MSKIFNRIKRINHGESKTKLYRVWRHMIERCNNKNNSEYHNYGERGIMVCEKWRNSFLSFKDWAINNGYKECLQIDRFPNNNGNYEPNNCRWATPRENSNNKRNNTLLTYNGITKTVTQWSDYIGLCPSNLFHKITRGQNIEQILTKQQIEKYTYNGKTLNLAEWAKELNMKYNTLRCRIRVYKWTVEKSFSTPIIQ
jgi:hypothetical protein